ncbi:MAG TPA: ankyrin repeat domain-containing protein, partial [Noviherbaspirillum sp.]
MTRRQQQHHRQAPPLLIRQSSRQEIRRGKAPSCAGNIFSIVANSDLPAIKKLNPEIVRELINGPDRASGLTPLMLALKSRNTETASWLISQGAKPNLPCARGTSPLMYAAKRGDCRHAATAAGCGRC